MSHIIIKTQYSQLVNRFLNKVILFIIISAWKYILQLLYTYFL